MSEENNAPVTRKVRFVMELEVTGNRFSHHSITIEDPDGATPEGQRTGMIAMGAELGKVGADALEVDGPRALRSFLKGLKGNTYPSRPRGGSSEGGTRPSRATKS